MSFTTANMKNHIRKRLFIGLLVISLGFLLLVFAAAWWIVSQQHLVINKIILTVVTAVIIIIFITLGLGLAALVWSLWHSQTSASLQSVMSAATNMLFPIAITIGKWLGLDEERIKNSFIQVSNQLVKIRIKSKKMNNIMILAPHCLQWVHCPHKITIDTNNCRECGKCPIAELLRLSRKYNALLLVVTGGTFARKVIMEKRPDAVVAIACERDLTSGIQDVGGLPVIGVINERPEGPCCNTRVDIKKVEEAIRYFQKGGNN